MRGKHGQMRKLYPPFHELSAQELRTLYRKVVVNHGEAVLLEYNLKNTLTHVDLLIYNHITKESAIYLFDMLLALKQPYEKESPIEDAIKSTI